MNPPSTETELGIETIEQSLTILGERIASPEFAARVRQILQAGETRVTYEVLIKKSGSGYTVGLFCKQVARKSVGLFIRLQ